MVCDKSHCREVPYFFGAVISPFNAWQIFRGSVTFPLRMERINASTLRIARWLETLPCVTFVSYQIGRAHV